MAMGSELVRCGAPGNGSRSCLLVGNAIERRRAGAGDVACDLRAGWDWAEQSSAESRKRMARRIEFLGANTKEGMYQMEVTQPRRSDAGSLAALGRQIQVNE